RRRAARTARVRMATIKGERSDIPGPEGTAMANLTPLQSLVASGTKLWLDSVDPQEVAANRAWGATGATSNPIIVADLIPTGRFDDLLAEQLRQGLDDEAIAWKVTDHLVGEAQQVFLPTWHKTHRN